MNGEDLLHDWEHNVVDAPTEWAFNWEYGECGTSQPTPRENHATLWLVMNEDDPAFTMRMLFQEVRKARPTIKFTSSKKEDDEDEYKLEVTNKRTKELLISGTMPAGTAHMDPNVGIYATFQATTRDGVALMEHIIQKAQKPGFQAMVHHDRVETDIGDGYRVVSVTGHGPDDKNDDDSSPESMATRFFLFHKDEEVALCHMSYRDGSYDPSFGPTIETIAVKQSRRGEGLAKLLWYYVRRFIEVNFTIECLNTAAPLGHIMIKATQITNAEVEIRVDKDGSRHPMGFKEYLYDYCGFSVREQKGAMAFMFASRRPKDEEAILYIPLLAPGAPSPLKIPKPGKAVYREKCGARMCHWCTTVSVDKMRCVRCGIAFYCNSKCQKSDWKRHRQWCAKPREEVRATLLEKGFMEERGDGEYVMMVNAPGRTFGL